MASELRKRLGHDGVHGQEDDGQHGQGQHRGDGELVVVFARAII